MIETGERVRFTGNEVDAYRRIGLDFADVRHRGDIGQEVSRWAHTLADDRFELLLKIASAMAEAKGAKMPPRLSLVPGEGSPRRY